MLAGGWKPAGMAKPYSMDLGKRVVVAVLDDGITYHASASRFGVAASSAIEWVRRVRMTGSAAPGQMVKIGREVIGCADMCVYRDTVGFSVSRELMEEIASKYVAGSSPLWRFRLKSQDGIDGEDRISPAEAAGILLAVQSYLAKHGFSQGSSC